MIRFWKKLLKEKISVRKTESLIIKNKKTSPELQNMQNLLSRLIGEKVLIKQNNKTKKGFIKINFDKKTVNRVLEKLKSIKPD
jgi:ParB family chromosome partitioning protein